MSLNSIIYTNDDSTRLWWYYYHMFTETDDSGNLCQKIQSFTITKPYKTNKIILIYNQSSSRPSTPSTGYQFYNSSSKKLEWYDGSAWHQYDMKPYEDDGTLYLMSEYGSSSYTLYKWYASRSSSYLKTFYPSAKEFCIMPLTVDYKSGMKKDDWYFDSNRGYLYWFDGNLWEQTNIYAPQISSYWLYSQNNCVYNIYHASSSVHYFNDYYYYAKITFTRLADNVDLDTLTFYIQSGASNYVVEKKDSSGNTAPVLYALAGDYADSGSAYRITARYYYADAGPVTESNACYLLDGTTNTSEYIDTEFISGRRGTINYPSITQESTYYQYNIVGETLSLSFTVTPTSSRPAGILRPLGQSDGGSESYPWCYYYNEYESKNGVIWYVQKVSGESTWSSRPIRRLAEDGLLKIISGTSDVNTSSIEIQFVEAGTYYVSVNCPYLKSGTYNYTPTSYKDTLYNHYEYNKSKPVIEIVSVTPAEYMQGSSVGTDGIPPYTVVFKDSSKATDAYQIPQASIQFDFGDSENTESVYITNSRTYLITAPNQTHVYNGYGGYTAKLIITDKRGNVTTGSCPFEPNKTARIIKPPTISYSPTSMLQPVLATGNAYVAGSPLPEVTWSYSTSGYSGSKTGEYVELSLLKAGSYTITCSPDGLTSTTWTPTVVSRGDTPDDSQTLEEFALIVLDENNYPIDYCKQHTDLQYIEYYQNTDTFSFSIPQTYEYAKYLQEGDLVILGYKGKARLMEITCRSLSDGVISISGESAFPQRIALMATKNSTSDGYDVQTYYGEDLIRYFIWTALADPYPDTTTQPREANLIVFDTSQNRGGTITYSARFDSLIDIITNICQSCNLGFTLKMRKLSSAVSTFDCVGLTVTMGEDRTVTSGGNNAVVFAPDLYKNCRVTSDSGSTGHNVAIAGDWHTGSSRMYKYYGDTSYNGFKRKELFVDCSSASGDTDTLKYAEMKRMAEVSILEEKQLSIKIQVLPSCQWKFGTDYDVGDVVTLVTKDRGTKDLQIYSAETVRRKTGDELYLSLGYESLTAPSLIKRTRNENTYARK